MNELVAFTVLAVLFGAYAAWAMLTGEWRR